MYDPEQDFERRLPINVCRDDCTCLQFYLVFPEKRRPKGEEQWSFIRANLSSIVTS